jgi:teichoic acid transport system permease protein
MASTDPATNLVALNAKLPTGDYLRAMWARRDLAWALPMEEVRAAHQNTLLGNIWHLANPLLSVGVYYLVFATLLNVNRGIDNYILWLTIGVFAFNLTNKCLLGGATAISSNQGLMRSIRFPRALLPVSVIVSKLLTFGFELGVLGALAVLTGESISSRWLLLPLVVGIHSAFNLGGAFIAARLNDSFRDVQQIIPFILRLLQYLSGVMFPLGQFLGSTQQSGLLITLVRLNPLVAILDLYRWVFLGTAVTAGEVIRLLVTTAVTLLFGFYFFRSAETRYGLA